MAASCPAALACRCPAHFQFFAASSVARDGPARRTVGDEPTEAVASSPSAAGGGFGFGGGSVRAFA